MEIDFQARCSVVSDYFVMGKYPNPGDRSIFEESRTDQGVV
jgi:hypothetical protein